MGGLRVGGLREVRAYAVGAERIDGGNAGRDALRITLVVARKKESVG